MTTTDAALLDLTPKQQHFANVYLETGNATEAYRQSFDCAAMRSNTITHAAYELTRLPHIAAMLDARRAAASAAVDAAVLQARLGAPGNLAVLDSIAALPIAGEQADTRQLPSIKGAAETLLGIAEVIPKAGVVVDARSVTVNIGAHDERLAGVTVEELTAIIDRLRAGDGAVDGSDAASA